MPRPLRQSARTDLEIRVRETATTLLNRVEKCCAGKAAHTLSLLKDEIEQRAACTVHDFHGSGREVRITVSSQNVAGHTPVTINLKRVWREPQVASAAA